jgi:16S rRNA C1402 N4-methylase RsmH
MSLGQMQIDGRIADVGVTEEQLDAAEVGASFEQMGGIAVA